MLLHAWEAQVWVCPNSRRRAWVCPSWRRRRKSLLRFAPPRRRRRRKPLHLRFPPLLAVRCLPSCAGALGCIFLLWRWLWALANPLHWRLSWALGNGSPHLRSNAEDRRWLCGRLRPWLRLQFVPKPCGRSTLWHSKICGRSMPCHRCSSVLVPRRVHQREHLRPRVPRSQLLLLLLLLLVLYQLPLQEGSGCQPVSRRHSPLATQEA